MLQDVQNSRAAFNFSSALHDIECPASCMNMRVYGNLLWASTQNVMGQRNSKGCSNATQMLVMYAG